MVEIPLLNDDGLVTRDGSSSDVEPSDGAVELDAPTDAPNGCASNMVRAFRSCIDRTEVSAKRYYAFMRDAIAVGRMPSHSRCAWATAWQPGKLPNGQPPAEDDLPIVEVNWCQAYEFCAAEGKRLCGRVGGGTLEPTEKSDPSTDEWYIACSGNVARAYAYGSTFVDGACNVKNPSNMPEAVGSRATCEGGVPGLFDMSGNVLEWFDACEPTDDASAGAIDSCPVRGGTFLDYSSLPAASESTCTRLDGLGRGGSERYIGFRCCATPTSTDP